MYLYHISNAIQKEILTTKLQYTAKKMPIQLQYTELIQGIR